MSPIEHPVRHLPPFWFAALLALTGACGSSSMLPVADGNNNGNSGGKSSGSIGFSLSPASALTRQGSTTSFTGTVTRIGGFTDDVTLTVTGAPTGVSTAVISQPTSGSRTGNVSISVSLTTATGDYPLTVTASGPGVASVSATYTLMVAVVYSGQVLSFPGSSGIGFIGIPVGAAVQLGGYK
jgi:hypothetical protein